MLTETVSATINEASVPLAKPSASETTTNPAEVALLSPPEEDVKVDQHALISSSTPVPGVLSETVSATVSEASDPLSRPSASESIASPVEDALQSPPEVDANTNMNQHTILSSSSVPDEKPPSPKITVPSSTAAHSKTEPSSSSRGATTSNSWRRSCRIHHPTLEDLKRQSFSDFIRYTVLKEARLDIDSDDEADEELDNPMKESTRPMELKDGLAKIVLPDGFWSESIFDGDRTGRGPAWQKGTPLGDMVIPSPIQQHVRGMAGIYEYTFTDQPECSVADFRSKADAYRVKQVGSAVEEDLTEERLEKLERQFWKRLGPTMPPSEYGADMAGSLFGDDPATGWSLACLDSCLHVLDDIPGVTSPYLYAGMWASVFCAHAEDMNLLSINYLHAGQPKLWYAVAHSDVPRYLSLAAFHYNNQATACPEFVRHKRCLLSPVILKKAGIAVQTLVQYPGQAVVTFPGSMHFGFNLGFNMAEATNFAVPEWLPFGRQAKVCLCRPDSVRIDMPKLTALLERYQADQLRRTARKRQTWKEWRNEREQRKQEDGVAEALTSLATSPKAKKKTKRKTKMSEQERKREFWVEVMQPVSSDAKSTGKKKRKKPTKEEVIVPREIWHLAKPIGRKRLALDTKVLCIMPAIQTGKAKKMTDEDEDDEQCFAGRVVEMVDNHMRVRLNGLPKSEDAWMATNSPKLFLDGGRWEEEHEEEGIPELHYWKVDDSKRVCTEK